MTPCDSTPSGWSSRSSSGSARAASPTSLEHDAVDEDAALRAPARGAAPDRQRQPVALAGSALAAEDRVGARRARVPGATVSWKMRRDADAPVPVLGVDRPPSSCTGFVDELIGDDLGVEPLRLVHAQEPVRDGASRPPRPTPRSAPSSGTSAGADVERVFCDARVLSPIGDPGLPGLFRDRDEHRRDRYVAAPRGCAGSCSEEAFVRELRGMRSRLTLRLLPRARLVGPAPLPASVPGGCDGSAGRSRQRSVSTASTKITRMTSCDGLTRQSPRRSRSTTARRRGERFRHKSLDRAERDHARTAASPARAPAPGPTCPTELRRGNPGHASQASATIAATPLPLMVCLVGPHPRREKQSLVPPQGPVETHEPVTVPPALGSTEVPQRQNSASSSANRGTRALAAARRRRRGARPGAPGLDIERTATSTRRRPFCGPSSRAAPSGPAEQPRGAVRPVQQDQLSRSSSGRRWRRRPHGERRLVQFRRLRRKPRGRKAFTPRASTATRFPPRSKRKRPR